MTGGQMVTAWPMLLAVVLGALCGIQAGLRALRGRARADLIASRHTGLPVTRPLRGISVAQAAAGQRDLTAAVRSAGRPGGCQHYDAEPVDLWTGERVAWVCPECPATLPAGFAPQPRPLTEEQMARFDMLAEQLNVLDGRISALIKAGASADSEHLARLRDTRRAVWEQANGLVQ